MPYVKMVNALPKMLSISQGGTKQKLKYLGWYYRVHRSVGPSELLDFRLKLENLFCSL